MPLWSVLFWCWCIPDSYVSRERPNDSSSHEVLGVQQFKPRELAEQINLNMNNAWGILMTLIDIFLKKEQGKYLILKDPNKVMNSLWFKWLALLKLFNYTWFKALATVYTTKLKPFANLLSLYCLLLTNKCFTIPCLSLSPSCVSTKYQKMLLTMMTVEVKMLAVMEMTKLLWWIYERASYRI